MDKDIEKGSLWIHSNGCEYKVIALTNLHSSNDNYVPTVVYQGLNGLKWSRPVSDWHRSMTPKED